MARHSEFNACESIALDSRQRHALMIRDNAAREALRRATITRNDRKRARRATLWGRVACAVVAVAFVGVVVWTLVGGAA